jgi:hypothetical protein
MFLECLLIVSFFFLYLVRNILLQATAGASDQALAADAMIRYWRLHLYIPAERFLLLKIIYFIFSFSPWRD